MKQPQPVRLPRQPARQLPDPPDYVPAERPADQDAFDEAMKVGYRGIREMLERRRKKH